MDPRETLSMMLDAWERDDFAALEEYADCMVSWLERGGFYPKDCEYYTEKPPFHLFRMIRNMAYEAARRS